MNEGEARDWLVSRLDVSRETLSHIGQFADAVIAENGRQNLISAASCAHIWQRHIVDSAQLLLHAGERDRTLPWLDLGTGAGFPGFIIALLVHQPVILVEARRKRAEFLMEQAGRLGLSHVEVVKGRLESCEGRPCSVISARAFAPMPRLLELAHRFAHQKTIWLLPKGRSAREELESVHRSWQGEFHVEQSLSDPEAAIIVGNAVRRRKSRDER